jgi:hypothetical protein
MMHVLYTKESNHISPLPYLIALELQQAQPGKRHCHCGNYRHERVTECGSTKVLKNAQ